MSGKKAVATRAAHPVAPVPSDLPVDGLMNFIATALTDPGIDVAKLKALLDMQREIVGEESRVKFINAMSAAQSEIQPVARTAENKQTQSFYAKLETVDEAIRPIYSAHGFNLSFDEEAGDGTNMMIVCEVSHNAGHTRRYRLAAPPDTMGPKGTPTKTVLHGRGSTITFLRRYLTCNIFNVVLRNMDDDGNRGGMKFITEEQIAEIEAILTETKADRPGFLRYMAVQEVGEIETKNFPAAMNALKRKQAKAAT